MVIASWVKIKIFFYFPRNIKSGPFSFLIIKKDLLMSTSSNGISSAFKSITNKKNCGSMTYIVNMIIRELRLLGACRNWHPKEGSSHRDTT